MILKLRKTRILIKEYRHMILKFKITRFTTKVFILRIISRFLPDIVFVFGIFLILFVRSMRTFSIMVCLLYDLSHFYYYFQELQKQPAASRNSIIK
jgi:hypothetical protein